MKLIGTELGRVVALMKPEEWRPRTLSTAEATNQVKERYKFVVSPNLSLEEIQKGGLKFASGEFKSKGKVAPIQDLSFYADGIVVTALTTDDAEACLKDLFGWAHAVAGIADLSNVGRRVFVSNVIVEFDKSVNKLIAQFQEYSRILNKRMQATYKSDLPMELRTLAFHYDQLALPPWINTTYFSLERRVGHKYEENRFFCEAPFRTIDHLQALESLESLLR